MSVSPPSSLEAATRFPSITTFSKHLSRSESTFTPVPDPAHPLVSPSPFKPSSPLQLIPPIPYDRRNEQHLLDTYWQERTRFIKHLESRAKKFAKKSKEDYDRARWGKSKAVKKPKLPKPSKSDRDQEKMIASGSTARIVKPTATALVRSFASTTTRHRAAKKNKKVTGAETTTLDVVEAVRTCRALEVTSPHAVYTLTFHMRAPGQTKSPSIRGRVSLPTDPRRITDRIMVFAEPNSLSAQLAQQEGVTYLGADEMFEPLLNGDMDPTKVLSTPSMLPKVTARLARFLGPKGLMPTVRRGGVGEGSELAIRIREAKGAIDWMSDSDGRVKAPVGRMHFDVSQVEANIKTVAGSVRAALTGNEPSSLDTMLLTRRQAKQKSVAGVHAVELLTTNGVKVTLKDAM